MFRVLVVDDDKWLRNLFSKRLRAAGYEVSMAANGQVGLHSALAEKPDLILLDSRYAQSVSN